MGTNMVKKGNIVHIISFFTCASFQFLHLRSLNGDVVRNFNLTIAEWGLI